MHSYALLPSRSNLNHRIIGMFDRNCPGALGTCQTVSNPVKSGHDNRRRTYISASREYGAARTTGAARRTHPAAASEAGGTERRDPAPRGADEPLERATESRARPAGVR